MAQVKLYYDKEGNTLTVWFSDPKEEYVCEETGEEVVLFNMGLGHAKRLIGSGMTGKP